MSRVLVTGATGFIGGHLVSRLRSEGYTVRALVHRVPEPGNPHIPTEYLVGDVLDPQLMKAATEGCETIFHLAGKVHCVSRRQREEDLFHAINVEGTRNLLEGAIANGVGRFVYFSSVKAMGEKARGCLDESHEPRPGTAYGRSKLAAEQCVLDFGHRQGIHVACLRLPLVYGPGTKGNLFQMISAIDRGFFPPLPKLENRRSLVHVADVVQAALLAAYKPLANGRCYIVTDARPYSTSELYELIGQRLGKRFPRWHLPVIVLKGGGYVGDAIARLRGRRCVFDSDALEKLIGSAQYSSEKISQELGYRPRLTFEAALPELIAWYREART